MLILEHQKDKQCELSAEIKTSKSEESTGKYFALLSNIQGAELLLNQTVNPNHGRDMEQNYSRRLEGGKYYL